MKIDIYEIFPKYEIDEDMAYRLHLPEMAETAGDAKNPILAHSMREDVLKTQEKKKVLVISHFDYPPTTTQLMDFVEEKRWRFGDYGELRGLHLDYHPQNPVIILPTKKEFQQGLYYRNYQRPGHPPITMCIFNIMERGFQLYVQDFHQETIWDPFWGFLVVEE